jgi:hypothetical protein
LLVRGLLHRWDRVKNGFLLSHVTIWPLANDCSGGTEPFENSSGFRRAVFSPLPFEAAFLQIETFGLSMCR